MRRVPRHHRDARLSGELAVGFRHIGGTAFLAASDRLNLVLCVVQCIDNRKIILPERRKSCRHRGCEAGRPVPARRS